MNSTTKTNVLYSALFALALVAALYVFASNTHANQFAKPPPSLRTEIVLMHWALEDEAAEYLALADAFDSAEFRGFAESRLNTAGRVLFALNTSANEPELLRRLAEIADTLYTEEFQSLAYYEAGFGSLWNVGLAEADAEFLDTLAPILESNF